jgi:hypothetical protein
LSNPTRASSRMSHREQSYSFVNRSGWYQRKSRRSRRFAALVLR